MAVNTFRPIHSKPALVCIDWKAGTFTRYWPKYPSGFLVDRADLPPELPAAMLPAAIENFRQKGFAK